MSNVVELPSTAFRGRVSWFNSEKQYGFVRLDDAKGDAFLHMSVLNAGGYYSLPRGTTVHVRVEPDRGKYKVVEVLQVDTSTAHHGEPSPLMRKKPNEILAGNSSRLDPCREGQGGASPK